MTILATDDSWRIVTAEGELVPVRIQGGDVQVGQPKGEIVQAPFSSAVFLAKGDGEWESRRIPIDFLVLGRGVLDKHGARAEETALRSALRYPIGLYGARSKEGLYLPLRGALPNGDPLDDEPGQRVLPYELIAASVKENTLERGWEYPILDGVSVQDAQTVLVARQSRAGFPALLMNGASRWSAPVTFTRMTQGTLAVGYLLQSVGAFPLLSLGLPGDGAASQSLVYDTGSFIAHAGAGSLTATQDQLGGFGYPAVLAATLVENGMLNLYSFSRLGFQAHGTAPVGTILPYASQRAYLGASVTGPSLNGVIFPGAPQFAMPAFTHRVMPVEEIREGLGLWYQEIYRQPAFSADPPPYGLTLTLPEFPEIVAGKTDTIAFTVERAGGFVGDFDFEDSASDDPSIRIGFSRQEEDDENPDGSVETWVLTRTVEEAAEVREHTIKIVARAEGWTSDGPYAAVIDEDSRNFMVQATEPAIAADAVAVHLPYTPKAFDLTALKRDASTSGSHPLVNLGLANFTSRLDGLSLDGTDIAPYGKSLWTVPDLLDMAADFTVHIQLWDVDKDPFGTVYGGLASRDVKGDYLYLYKGQSGLQVKLAGGGGTNLTDTPNLAVTSGITHATLRFNKAANRLTLSNRDSDLAPFQTARAWSGVGRLTFGGVRQSDGTVLGLSKCVILGHVSHQKVVSDVQLERQAAYMDTFTLRTPQCARPEFAPGADYIFEVVAGQTYINRHPATATATPQLTAVGSPLATSDSFKTNGASSHVKVLLARGAQSPNDAIFATRNFRDGGRGTGAVQVNLTVQNSSAYYLRLYMSANNNNKRGWSMVGAGGTSAESAAVVPAGDRIYSLRCNAGKLEWKDVGLNETMTQDLDADLLVGNLQFTFGAQQRLDGSNSPADRFGTTEIKSFNCYARPLTAAEHTADGNNLNGVWDYSGAPAGGTGGADGGTNPAPTISAFSASPSTINSGSSATLAWTVSVPYTAISLSGTGNVSGPNGSISVSPTTTTTYTLTASNGSASSTAQVTVVVTGTGGSSGSMDFSRLSPQMNPNYSTASVFPAGTQQRTYADIIEKAVLKAILDITDGMSMRPRVPVSWNGTYTQLESKRGDPSWDPSGQYSTARFNSIGFGNLCWLARITTDPRWIKKIAEMATYYLLLQDYRASPDSKSGWREAGYSATLGMPYGFVKRNSDGSTPSGVWGTRLPLEQGCGVSGPMHAAYLLWENRALDSTGGYAKLSHQLRCLFVKHTLKNWDEYQAKNGNLYSSGTTRKYPESVRKRFVHPDLGEHSALIHWGLLETSIYNSGLTGAVSVTMTGQDFASSQYSGAMIDATKTESLGLHPSTSANKTTHEGWQRGVLGFKNLAESKTNILMPNTKLEDATMAARIPDGALIWGQRNYGSGSTEGTAAAPTSYNNETLDHLMVLRVDGPMSEALGSDANADLYMRRVAGREMAGPLADTASTGKVANASLGIIDTKNSSGQTVTIHRWKNASLIRDDSTGWTISKDEGGRNTYWKYGDVNKYTRDMTFFPAIWDASGYMDQCYAKLAANKGATVTGGTHAGGAGVMLCKLIVKNGRGN